MAHGRGEDAPGLNSDDVEIVLQRVDVAVQFVERHMLYTGTAIVRGDDAFQREASERLEAAGLAWSYREIDPDVCGEELDRPAYADAVLADTDAAISASIACQSG